MLSSLVKRNNTIRSKVAKQTAVKRADPKDMANANMLLKVEAVGEMLKLRRAGFSCEYIGKQLGCSASYVHSGIRDALQRMREEYVESLSDVKDIEIQRLDELMAPFYKRALGGDEWALDRVIKIMERRARLLGIDAAAKLEHAGEIVKQYVGIDISEV